ncbi:MAG: hypothetical protein ACOC6C_01950 [Verrucomicrobiota bacterium]
MSNDEGEENKKRRYKLRKALKDAKGQQGFLGEEDCNHRERREHRDEEKIVTTETLSHGEEVV